VNGDGTWTAFWDAAPFALGCIGFVVILAVVTRWLSPAGGDGS
jgi:hypothetical protein